MVPAISMAVIRAGIVVIGRFYDDEAPTPTVTPHVTLKTKQEDGRKGVILS